ncbi:hypothetical protein NKDENANG_02574 [Candidatus Entotheonellaceae bacterium PAL068K]
MAPELREDRGEIEAAGINRLPYLVVQKDVLGDLHVHSDWGSGSHGVEAIARAAQKMGYRYVAICDYASRSGTGRGLTPVALTKQMAAIRQLNVARFRRSYHPRDAHDAPWRHDGTAWLAGASAVVKHPVAPQFDGATSSSGRLECHLKNLLSIWEPVGGHTETG